MSLVAFGPPMVIAGSLAVTIGRYFGMSPRACFGLYLLMFVVICAAWWVAFVAWSRRKSGRNDEERP